MLSTDVDETAASLDEFAAGDGDAWRELDRELRAASSGPLLDVDDVADAAGAAARLRLAATLGPARPPRVHAPVACSRCAGCARSSSRGEGAALLLTGNAMHSRPRARRPTERVPRLDAHRALGQQYGFPVPEGGAGQLTAALVRRLTERGGDRAVQRRR